MSESVTNIGGGGAIASPSPVPTAMNVIRMN